MGCIVLMSVDGGDRYAFNIEEYEITFPTQTADLDPVWDGLHELAEELAFYAGVFDPGAEYTIGVTDERDAGAARMAFTKVLWCGGYYTMPTPDDEDTNDE